MSDVNCPYCGAGQEINHDDGYGYEDGGEFEQHCTDCGQEFKYTTSISISYEVSCQDDDHDMEQCPIEEHRRLWSCSKCDHYEVRD